MNPDDNTCNGNSPCYTTIQEGIDGAQDGSGINVAQGIYTESISLNNKKTVILKGDGMIPSQPRRPVKGDVGSKAS